MTDTAPCIVTVDDPVAYQLLKFVTRVASMKIDGDIVDGKEYLADGNDDEIDALYGFIHKARELLGFDDPQGSGWGEAEERSSAQGSDT